MLTGGIGGRERAAAGDGRDRPTRRAPSYTTDGKCAGADDAPPRRLDGGAPWRRPPRSSLACAELAAPAHGDGDRHSRTARGARPFAAGGANPA